MVEPRKRIRQVLHSIYPLGYRIKAKSLDRETMNQKVFIEIIEGLKKLEDRSDFMASELGLDMTMYDDQFFAIIDNLFKLNFSKEQQALIQLYLYQLVPDKDWDGTIVLKVDKGEQTVNFKTPVDVWNVIKKLG